MTKYADEHRTHLDFENMESRWVNDVQLAEILREHRKWVDSDGEGGKLADLSRAFLKGRSLRDVALKGANLQEAQLVGADLENAVLRDADLRGVNLQGARLKGADLCEANLSGANLRDADLREAQLYKAQLEGASLYRANVQDANLARSNFRNANFLETNLRDTNLRNADLEGATGLSGADLAGADVSGSVLPSSIPEFKGLDIIAEASTNAKKIFSTLLLACVFSWLTIATTTDVGLLTNTASSPLPIIQTEIPIAYFYLAAPFVLLCLFLYLHVYMQRLWEALATQPARFRDGSPLDERAYPWLVIGLVRAHFKRLRAERPPLSRLQTGFTLALAYWTLPLTLFLFWARYLPRQEWSGTLFHILLLSASIGLAFLFSHLTQQTLRAKRSRPALTIFRDILAERGWLAAFKALILGPLAPFAVALVTGGLMVSLSSGSIGGTRGSEGSRFQVGVPKILGTVGISAFASFGPAEVSIKPAGWEEGDDARVSLVKGAPLTSQSLRYLDARGAFLVKAEMAGADLTWADLGLANLRQANLREAILESASLDGARLREANLTGGKLQYASFDGGADLTDAILEDADLSHAYLHSAILEGARLAGAVLVGAVLTDSSLEFAELIGADLQGADLQTAILVNTSLIDADLRRANLTGALLEQADLTGADLEWTDLRQTTGLTAAQVRAATQWERAFLPADMLESLGLPADHNEKLTEEDQRLGLEALR